MAVPSVPKTMMGADMNHATTFETLLTLMSWGERIIVGFILTSRALPLRFPCDEGHAQPHAMAVTASIISSSSDALSSTAGERASRSSRPDASRRDAPSERQEFERSSVSDTSRGLLVMCSLRVSRFLWRDGCSVGVSWQVSFVH